MSYGETRLSQICILNITRHESNSFSLERLRDFQLFLGNFISLDHRRSYKHRNLGGIDLALEVGLYDSENLVPYVYADLPNVFRDFVLSWSNSVLSDR